MGAALNGQTKSRNSSMPSPAKRDEVSNLPRTSKLTVCNGDKSSALSKNIPVDSETLRELKRRVLVCLDNNATAVQVARSLMNDCPDLTSKLKGVADVIANGNHNNNNSSGTNSRKRHFDVSCLSNGNGRHNPCGSPRRKTVSTNGSIDVQTNKSVTITAFPKQQKLTDNFSPVEVVTECFNVLDRLLSDVAERDNEISRLQMKLSSAESVSRSLEKRLNYMKQYCILNGISLEGISTKIKSEPDDFNSTWSECHNGLSGCAFLSDSNCVSAFKEGNTSENVCKSQSESKTQSRSPRKSRRSSVELLDLPSIHSSGLKEAADNARSMSADHTSSSRKRRASGHDRTQSNVKRLKPTAGQSCKQNKVIEESESKQGPLDNESPRTKKCQQQLQQQSHHELVTNDSVNNNRVRGRKIKRKRGCPSVQEREDDKKAADTDETTNKDEGLSNCMTTEVKYHFGDFESMLSRREKELAAAAVVSHACDATKHIDTPGWRVAPVRGRTRAATHAAAAAAAASSEPGPGEPVSEPSADIPAEGNGFEEWAALSDEPFEARHYRHELIEKKREKAEQRAYREYLRNARLRARQQYLQQPGGGLAATTAAAEGADAPKTAVTSCVVSNGHMGGVSGLVPTSVAAPELGTTNTIVPSNPNTPARRGLPDSLLPDPMDESEVRNCHLYYYSMDNIPVVAFGRLLPQWRKKYHGFSLPWNSRRGR